MYSWKACDPSHECAGIQGMDFDRFHLLTYFLKASYICSGILEVDAVQANVKVFNFSSFSFERKGSF